MATETVKLNSGFDMPVIGLGTWQVCNFCSFLLWSCPSAHYYLVSGIMAFSPLCRFAPCLVCRLGGSPPGSFALVWFTPWLVRRRQTDDDRQPF